MPFLPLLSQIITAGGLPVLTKFLGGVLAKGDGPLKQAGELLLSNPNEVSKLSGKENVRVALAQLENEAAETQGNFDLLISQQETQRKELASSSVLARNWRPLWGYATCLAWLTQMGAITWAVIVTPELSSGIISAFSGLGFMWAMALGILGVSVNARTRDKKLQAHSDAGTTPPLSLIETVISKFK